MIVVVGGGPERCRVDEPEDCGRLHVEADGLDLAEVAAAVTADGLGSMAGDGTVWLEVGRLRALCRGGTTPDWDERFAAMIEYARSAGWLDAGGARIAAHVVGVGS